jgi:hypothetical protein
MGLHLASTTSAAWFVGECYPNHLQRQFVRNSGFSGPPGGRRFLEARGVVLPSFALIRNFRANSVLSQETCTSAISGLADGRPGQA